MTIWLTRIAYWISRATNTHTFRICNTYWFSTSTVVARTRLSVTLPVLFISEFVNNGHNAPQFKAVEYSDLVTLCNSCYVMNFMDFLIDTCSAAVDSV